MPELVPIQTKRPRLDKRRARNRQALLMGALALVGERGSAGLTVAAVAARADLHKQAFYAHFKDLDECLAALAGYVGHELLGAATEHRLAEVVRAEVRDREAERGAMHALLEFALERRKVHALLLKERYSDGPLGQTMRGMIKWSRRACTESLWVLAHRLGIDSRYLHDVEALAHMMIELSIDTFDRIIEDESLDPRTEADRVLRYAEATIASEFNRLLQHA